MLIKVEKVSGTQNQHRAIFEEPELMAKNGNKPVVIPIENLEQYFKDQKDMRLYNYF